MPNGGGATVGLYQNGGYDEPLQMRLTRSPQRSLHRPDLFPHTPAYDLFPCKYESNCESFMPLHVEMNSDILTISQTADIIKGQYTECAVLFTVTQIRSNNKDTQQTVRTYRKINKENKAKELLCYYVNDTVVNSS